jgi:hypothetical protein
LSVVQFIQHHHELVAAEPCHGVGLADAALQPLCHLDQQQVADDVPVRVIQRLEVVEIEEHQRAIASRCACWPPWSGQAVIEQPAIGQIGEHVVEGQVPHLLLHPLRSVMSM